MGCGMGVSGVSGVGVSGVSGGIEGCTYWGALRVNWTINHLGALAVIRECRTIKFK